MPEEHTTEARRAELRLQLAVNARQLELELFWKRALFFWGFIAAAFAGFALVDEEQPLLTFILVCFGFICSLCWTLVNRGSKVWYEAWAQKVADAEHDVIGPLFAKPEPKKPGGRYFRCGYSVSKTLILLSDFVLVLWSVLALRQFFVSMPRRTYQWDGEFTWMIIIGLFTLLTAAVILMSGRSALGTHDPPARGSHSVGARSS